MPATQEELPATASVGGLANLSTGLFLLPVLLAVAAARLGVASPDNITSNLAKEEENWVSNCSNLVSSPATLDAVSDMCETDVLSALGTYLTGMNVTEGVGVIAMVWVVPVECEDTASTQCT